MLGFVELPCAASLVLQNIVDVSSGHSRFASTNFIVLMCVTRSRSGVATCLACAERDTLTSTW